MALGIFSGVGSDHAQYPASPESPRPLDIFGGVAPAFAYGLRLLDTDYTGYAIRVRRDADDIEVEVKFDGAGNVSLASPIVDGGTEQTGSVTGGTYSGTMTLKAFAGSDTCRVVKWYDQSGNTRDSFNTVEANQPILITLGTLEVDGIHFQGGLDFLAVDYKFTTTDDHTFHAVTRTDSEGTFGILSDIDVSYNDGAELITDGSGYSYRIDSTDLDVPATTTGKSYLLASYETALGSNEQQMRVNGVLSQKSCTETLSFSTVNRIRVGARRDSDNEMDGKISEIIAWNSKVTTAQQDILEANTLQFFDLDPFSTKSLLLDGTNDYVDAGTAIGDELGDNYAGDLTVSLWFKADVTSGDDAAFSIGPFAGAHGVFTIHVASQNLYVSLADFAWYRIVSFTDTTNWNHVAFVYKSGSESDSKIYLNGVPAVTTTNGTFPAASAMDFAGMKTVIGAYKSSSYTFDGNIDDVSLFTEALSETQIVDILYNKGRPRDLSVLSPTHWWKMGENVGGTGAIEDDGSGTSEGTLVNGPAFSTDTSPDLAKFSSRSILFDSSNDWMSTGADSTLASKSYSFWAKSDETAANGVFDHGSIDEGAFLFNNSSGKPLLYFGASSFRYWVDNSSQDDSAWHHHCVVVVHDDITACKWYVDGVVQSADYTNSSGSAAAYTTGIRIGQGGTNYFDGSLSDFSIHDGELTAAQVADIYNGGNPKNIDYLSPDNWWRMGEGDDSSSTTITDLGGEPGYANHGTLTNGPLFKSDAPYE